MLHNSCMFLDWTNWTFLVTAIALVAFGFCLRDTVPVLISAKADV
jgi:hypothetical protein